MKLWLSHVTVVTNLLESPFRHREEEEEEHTEEEALDDAIHYHQDLSEITQIWNS